MTNVRTFVILVSEFSIMTCIKDLHKVIQDETPWRILFTDDIFLIDEMSRGNY